MYGFGAFGDFSPSFTVYVVMGYICSVLSIVAIWFEVLSHPNQQSLSSDIRNILSNSIDPQNKDGSNGALIRTHLSNKDLKRRLPLLPWLIGFGAITNIIASYVLLAARDNVLVIGQSALTISFSMLVASVLGYFYYVMDTLK